MRYFIILLLILLTTEETSSQKRGRDLIDSLNEELSIVYSDSARQLIMSKLGWPYTMTGKIDSAFYAAHSSLTLSEKLNYNYGIADAYNDLGNIFNLIGDYPEAIEAFRNTIKRLENVDDENAKKLMSWAYSNLSESYLKWGNDEEAFKNVTIALKIKNETGETYWLGSSYYNLAEVYIKQRKFELAYESYDKGLKAAGDAKNTHHLILGHIGLGNIYADKGEYNKALDHYKAALKIATATDEKFAISRCYQNIGVVYNHLDKPETAKKWLNQSIHLSNDIGAIETLKESYLSLVYADSLLGDYQSAFDNYKYYTLYNDSLFSEKNSHKIAYLEMSYVFERQRDSIRLVNDKEIAIRDGTLQVHKREKRFFLSGLIIVGIFGGLLFRQNRIRKRNNIALTDTIKELNTANHTKNRLLSIIHHDLRSPVSSLIHFLHFKKENRNILDEKRNAALEDATLKYAENLLCNMEDLLLWSKSQMVNFSTCFMQVPVHKMFEDNKKFFSSTENINLLHHNPQLLHIHTDENYLKTIIRNLTSNAIQATKNISQPTIIWKAYINDEGNTAIAITDNGMNAHPDKFKMLFDDTILMDTKSGLGLHLVRDLVKLLSLRITLDISTDNSTTLVLQPK